MARSSVDKNPIPIIRNYDSPLSLAFEGKVFGVCNPTVGTPVVGQTSYAATLATLSFRNLGSKAMIPIACRMVQSGTVAGGRIIAHVETLDVDQFTSATALTAKPRNNHLTAAAGVLAYHTATLPTFTTGNATLVYTGEYFHSVSAANADNTINLFPEPGFCVVKPGGALHVYTWAGTTGPGWSFNVSWAEVEV